MPLMRVALMLVTLLSFIPSAQADLESFVAQQLTATMGALSNTSYPHYTSPTTQSWVTTSAGAWTSGFFPGALWLMYEHGGQASWRTGAEARQAGIESQKTRTNTHDLGFMLFTSFGNAYRLTNHDPYRQVVLTAAGSLATRYSAVVGCIKTSYPGGTSSDFKTIIDTLMNLELLFWAAQHGGNSGWAQMAQSHALRAAAEHVRSDGSTYHVVNYSPTTGAVKGKATAQGYNTESTWARGQAWAIYGFTMAYRYTHHATLLQAARVTADYWISHVPADEVPYWDFEAPNLTTQPRDSSAAAIAASGLLELSQLDPDATRRQGYQAQAQATLASLSSSAYLAQGTPNKAILLHGTSHKPNGNADTGLIYGDYYFMEALIRSQDTTPPPPTDVNLAVAAVTASAHDGNVPTNTLDNNLSTRWSAQGDGQWIRFDLGATKTVSQVAAAWYLGNTRTARFDVQTSSTGTTWTTRFTGVSSGTTTQSERYDFPDVAARYVRILGHGNSQSTWNSITEVDIYGR
jgi:unsaturated chondroitin disaccharide hydrolase